MEEVTVEKARARLAELVAAAAHGEPVLIVGADHQLVQLVPVRLAVPAPRYLAFAGAATPPRFVTDPGPAPPAQPPQFGNAAGTGWLADDFDDPLDDFRAYME